MSLFDKLLAATQMSTISEALSKSFNDFNPFDGLFERHPAPFHKDMTMRYSVVHYIQGDTYMGSRQIPLSLSEAKEAQTVHPDCVMWRLDSGGNWVWWYHEDATIPHWRMAHIEVMPVPEILKMMKLVGAL